MLQWAKFLPNEHSMQIQTKIPVFDDFFYILTENDSPTDPAEIHGMLCGLICMGRRANGQFWLDSVLKLLNSQAPIIARYQGMLINLYDVSCRQLIGMDSDFQLLLPSENSSLIGQAEALSNWCKGFLAGLHMTGGVLEESISRESIEGLQTMEEIANLDFVKIEINEHDKFAYVHVVDFVRATVIRLHRELANKKEKGKSNKYLH